MRALVGLLLLVGAGLAGQALALRLGDADTFVPPPENVAKAFLTHLHGHRPSSAAALVGEGSCGLDEARLRAIADVLPRAQHIDARETGRSAVAAAAEVELQEPRGRTLAVPVRLVWQRGQWRVQCATLPDRQAAGPPRPSATCCARSSASACVLARCT